MPLQLALRQLFVQSALIASFAFPSAVFGAEVPTLQFFTHELAPLNFTDKGEVTGLCTEIVRELQRRSGLKSVISIVPWARGYKMVSSTPDTVLFFVTYTEDRKALFQWVGPLVNVPSAFYARAGSSLRIDTLDDARQIPTIIVHRDSHLESALVKLGFKNLLSVNTPEDAIRALLLQDENKAVMLITGAPLHSVLKAHGYADDAVKQIYLARRSQGYLAVSKSTVPSVAARLQQALDDMKRDGSFTKLYAKWLPNDEAPGFVDEPELDRLK